MIASTRGFIGGAAWFLAAISTLLFIASMTGDGTGLFGLGILTAPGWSWAFLAVISAGTLAILILATSRRDQMEGRGS